MPAKTKTKKAANKAVAKKKTVRKKTVAKDGKKIEKNQPSPRPMAKQKKDIGLKAYVILSALIVLGAFFLRSYHLGTLPPGVYPDEAVNGMDAATANADHHWQVFYTNNNGREGLFINLIAISFKLFGISVVSLKPWSVIFGTLTVLGMILLGEELLGSRRAGLIAGFLTATSFWAINFSRIGFRAIMLPFVLVFTIFFLIRGIQKKKIIDYVVAGLFFGLGLHTYIAFRIAPLILIVLLAAFMVSRRRFLRTHWKEVLAFVLATTVVAMPILMDFYHHPDHFSGRSSQVSVFNPEVNQGHLLLTLGKTFGLSMAKYNFYGDQNWRHNLPPWPEIFPTTSIFFLAGLFYFIWEFFALLWKRFRRGERDDRLILVSLLLAWFFAMLLPEAISSEGLPHALRSIGTMPVALLLTVFSIEAVFKRAEQARYAKYKEAVWTLLAVLVIGTGIWTTRMYFVDWGGNPEIHGAFDEGYLNMARYINALPADLPKYVVDNGPGIEMEDGLQTSSEVVKLFTYGKTENLVFLEPDFDLGEIKTPSRIFLMNPDQGLMNYLHQNFLNSRVEVVGQKPDMDTGFTLVNIR
ncbi:MAG: glycosyltransferase family 39 protein [Candidatus Moranbacteria bacterium]|nr:glycosyltransferase family 39 protein [Candidatus Moranbacteria bacterium]